MVLITLDLLLLNFAFFISPFFSSDGIPSGYFPVYMSYLAISNALWLFLAFALRAYSGKNILVFENFTKRSLQVYLLWVFGVLFYLFFFRQVALSRFILLISIGGFGVGLMFNRFLYLSIRSYNKNKETFVNKVLIIGYNDLGKKLATYFEEGGFKTQILGFVEDNAQINYLTPYPILRGLQNTVQMAKEMNALEIYSTIAPEADKRVYDLMQEAEVECIRFKIVPDFSVFINRSMHIDYFYDLPIITLRNEAMDDIGNKIKKRVLDIVVSSFVTVFILTWLIPLIALIIKLESKGPVFFPQLRTGKNKKNFYCLKFRSMHVNKESDSVQASRNDSRITKIGKFMRKTSLDEFPQFINVLKGEMSLVGPRPHMIKHTDDYSKLVDEYMVRQFLKPGITGWAQVNGFRGEISNPDQIKKRVAHDIWYMENWTLWLDIKILFLTVYNVLKGEKNAY